MRGTIRKRLAQDGTPRYDCMFRVGRTQVSKTFTTRKAADDYLADTIGDIGAGTYVKVSPATMADVFEKWKAALLAAETLGQIKKSTRRSYVSIVTHTLAPTFGHIQSDALSKPDVSEWKQASAEEIARGTLAPKTFNNACGVLSTCLEWAREHHYLASNPLPKRLRARRTQKDRVVIQGAEIARLWHAAEGQDRVILALALFAGLRRGEIFGADWSAVVWPKGRTRAGLRVTQAFVQRQIVPPKTAAGRREVALPSRLVELLRQHHRARPPLALPNGAQYLIRAEDGTPLDPDNWAKKVLPAIRLAAKLPEAVTLHALRHTFGSLLLAKNAPIKHVSEQMGHASIAVTLDIYQHILRATSALATRQLDRLIPEHKAPRKPLRLVKSA